jgi:hypothetical protein
MDLPTITRKKLDKIIKNTYYSFYIKPKNITKGLSLVSNKTKVTSVLNSYKRFGAGRGGA